LADTTGFGWLLKACLANMTNLQIEVSYEQPLEILVEFPVAVLASYHGSSNLDTTWDDTIAPLLHQALREHKVRVKSASLSITPDAAEAPGKLSYQLLLIVRPPIFDFAWLIAALDLAGFLRGLHLKIATKAGTFESYYQESARRMEPPKKPILTSLMTIPPEVAAFVEQGIVVGKMCLPDHYPKPDGFMDFQAGYRYHALTGEPLTGEQAGDFRPSWYVVAANYFDDPFYVDFLEHEAGFPVYFSYHGAGTWTPLRVSATLLDFTAWLTTLAKIANDAAASLRLLRSIPDVENEFWQEVVEEYETSEPE
jgi:hypothetical protein